MLKRILPKQMQVLASSGYRLGQRIVRDGLGLYEDEEKIIADSQVFWTQISQREQEGGNAHWRGNGVFSDRRWSEIGTHNLSLFQRMAGTTWLRGRAARVVDWGCGGGANAVHFGVGAAHYYGVDITQASLDECARQMHGAGLHNFVPVLIDAAKPEQARELIPSTCDLILSTYVFEAMPSKAYGERVLRLMAELLAPGALAFLQIKYSDGTLRSRPYRWNYARHMPDMTTYRVEEFWTMAEAAALEPRLLTLEPVQPLVSDRRYAYLLLRKPEQVASQREQTSAGLG